MIIYILIMLIEYILGKILTFIFKENYMYRYEFLKEELEKLYLYIKLN